MKTVNVIFLFFFLFACNPIQIIAQDALLKILQVDKNILPEQNKNLLNNLDTLSYKKSVQIIEWAALSAVLKGQKTTFSLLNQGTKLYTLQGTLEQNTAATELSYWGQIKDQTTTEGFISIAKTPDGFGGIIQTATRFYTIYPLDATKGALLEYDLTKNLGDCANPPPVAQLSVDCESNNDNCPATIDVLFLITPEAKNFLLGNFTGPISTSIVAKVYDVFAKSAAANVNLVFSNSLVNGKNVRVRAISHVPNTSITNLLDAKDYLINSSAVAQLLQDYRADVVFLITNHPSFGVGKNGVSAALFDPNKPFAVVQLPTVIGPTFTFAHELGHIMNGDHQGVPSSNTCAHGHSNPLGKIRSVVTTTNSLSNFSVVPFYATDEVKFNNFAVGFFPNNLNAKVFKSTACAVAGWRASPGASVKIDGFNPICDGTIINLSANITPAAIGMPNEPQSPYLDYKWEWSTSSLFTTVDGILGSTPSILLSGYPPTCQLFFVRVTVTGSNGVTMSSPSITVSPSNCPNCKKAPSTLTMYVPSGNTAIQLNLENDTPTTQGTILVTNMSGAIVSQHKISIEKDQRTLSVNLPSLTNGMYILSVIGANNDVLLHQKMVIQNE
jgi:hypothetical protein